jgi:lipopolysaccharide assembly protein A
VKEEAGRAERREDGDDRTGGPSEALMTTTKSAATSTPPRRRMPRATPGRVAAVVLAALVALFVAQNRDSVSIRLFTFELSAPLWLTLTVIALLGLVTGFLLSRKR